MDEDVDLYLSVGFEVGTNHDLTLDVTPPSLELPLFIDVARLHDLAVLFISVQN